MRSILQDPAFLRPHYYDDPVTGELHVFAPQAHASYAHPAYGQEGGGGGGGGRIDVPPARDDDDIPF